MYPLFVYYYTDIPRVAQQSIVGIPITSKTLSYIIGLQLMNSTRGSLIVAASGLIAGLLTRYNVCNCRNWLQIPASFADAFYDHIGWLVDYDFGLLDDPLVTNTMQLGATPEIQRQQQMEIYEQQVLYGRINQHNTRPPGPAHRGPMAADLPPTPPPPPPAMREVEIQQLVDMGFDRQHVIVAMQRSNNDINLATNYLLSHET